MNTLSSKTNGRRLPPVGTEARTESLLVTPEQAAKWLAQNSASQRKISQPAVESYAHAMRTGQWKLTHQGIAFNQTGELIDGQHRLSAVVRSGRPVSMMVTTGLAVEVNAPIDQGYGRSVAHVLGISGKRVGVSVMLRKLELGTKSAVRASTALVKDVEGRAPYVPELCDLGNVVGRETNRLRAPIVAACAFAFPLVPDLVRNFVVQARDGEMLESGDPAFALRSLLFNHHRLTPFEMVHATLTALVYVVNRQSLVKAMSHTTTGYRLFAEARRTAGIEPTPDEDTIAIIGGPVASDFRKAIKSSARA